MIKHLLFILFLFISNFNFGQCYEDRHNTSTASNWLSCERSTSINPARGDSYWINYDLGEVKVIKEVHIWNINNPDQLTQGARQIAVDYSTDGVNWSFWGIWEVGQGTGSGFYEGEPGPDFEDLSTRHLLLTILDNHGGDCSGFGEIKIGVASNSVSTTDLVAQENVMSLYPNPAETYTNVKLKSSYVGAATAEILDISGKKIYAEKINLIIGEQEIRLPLNEAVSGQYIVRIITPDSENSSELTITKTK